MSSVTISGTKPRIIRAYHNGAYAYPTRLDVVHNGIRVKVWELMPLSLPTFKRTLGTGGGYIEFRSATRTEMGYAEDEPYGKYSCTVYAVFEYVQNQIIAASGTAVFGVRLLNALPETDSGISYELGTYNLGTFSVPLRIYPNINASGSNYMIASASMKKSISEDKLVFSDFAAFRDANLSGMSEWSLTPDGSSTTVSKSGVSATIIK